MCSRTNSVVARCSLLPHGVCAVARCSLLPHGVCAVARVFASPSMAPAMDITIPDWGKYAPLSHDPGGQLLKMGMAGSRCLVQAQDVGGEERSSLLEQALELRLKERNGWLAVRTPEHPDGDRLGAAKAAFGIGTIYLKMLAIEHAREWTQRARAECPLQAEKVLQYIDFNIAAIEDIARKRYVDRTVRVHGLLGKPEYNGQCGRVLCHAESRWKVLLEAGGAQRLISVHEHNLMLL
jgi:hypothetical protein